MIERSGACELIALGTVAALLPWVSSPPSAPAYGDGPPPGHTGGFGEPTCVECHFAGPVEDPSAALRLHGISPRVVSDSPRLLQVEVEREGLRRAGFQLTARMVDAPEPGAQAGHFRVVDDRVQLVQAEGSPVVYAQQTGRGSRAETKGRAAWTIEWTPPVRDGRVAFDVAVNASNDDDSEFGDLVLIERRVATIGGPAP